MAGLCQFVNAGATERGDMGELRNQKTIFKARASFGSCELESSASVR